MNKETDPKTIWKRVALLVKKITGDVDVVDDGSLQDQISGLRSRLNALVDSDDATLDQLSEIIAYIKSNRELIDAITTSKVSVVDIVNDLTSTSTNKPLSAAQGKILKDLISGLTASDVGLGNVGNFKAVSTVASQGLSDTEKANARSNIGAAPTSHASTATTYGASSATNYGHAMASSTTPKANGTAAMGTETAKFARGDHVHPLQTSVSGSSGSCTGNAATATKLSTARTIRTNLASTSTASFDGTANITPGVTGTLPVANGGTGKTTLTSGQVLVGNGTSAVSQRAIDTTSGGTQDSTSLITSGAVYDTMVFNAISITGTGNLSISSIFSGDYSDLVIELYADVSGVRYMYTWLLPTADILSSGQLHLISGYKTGNYEGIGEVLITNRTAAKIVNCIFSGTQYNTTATLKIKYR